MNLDELNKSGYITYSVLAGSHLYGLNTESSDIDIRGIFNLPVREFIIPGSTRQISCDTNDTTYYEIHKYLQLLQSANPNILEILFAPEDKVLLTAPIMNTLIENRDKFLTKACKQSLGGYAVAQIQKARSQNKRCYNENIERLSILDFCYSYNRGRTTKFANIMKAFSIDQADLGTSVVSNFPGVYRVFSKSYALNRCPIDSMREVIQEWKPKGLTNSEDTSNQLRLSSIPKEVMLYGEMCLVYFNEDEYKAHCREYLETQDWITHRNKDRYSKVNIEGENYDVKNMMHCMRLLTMGIELAKTSEFNVVRTHDRQFLLDIRQGKFTYSYLKGLAEEKVIEMDESFSTSMLPNHVNIDLINQILLEFKGV